MLAGIAYEKVVAVKKVDDPPEDGVAMSLFFGCQCMDRIGCWKVYYNAWAVNRTVIMTLSGFSWSSYCFSSHYRNCFIRSRVEISSRPFHERHLDFQIQRWSPWRSQGRAEISYGSRNVWELWFGVVGSALGGKLASRFLRENGPVTGGRSEGFLWVTFRRLFLSCQAAWASPDLVMSLGPD
jgi:hypothetical protein